MPRGRRTILQRARAQGRGSRAGIDPRMLTEAVAAAAECARVCADGPSGERPEALGQLQAHCAEACDRMVARLRVTATAGPPPDARMLAECAAACRQTARESERHADRCEHCAAAATACRRAHSSLRLLATVAAPTIGDW